MGIARFAGREDGEFRGDGLADHDGACRAQPRDDEGIGGWTAACVQNGAMLGPHVGGVDDVLHTDRQAVQRT